MSFPQAPSDVVMVRPHHFHPNPETAADNSFQNPYPSDRAGQPASATHQSNRWSELALKEVTQAVQRLREGGVTVHLFEDQGERNTPDSVFPNNWFSTHSGGHVALYPMYATNRRRERRSDVIEMLKAQYRVQDVIDYSGLEQDNLFLEGTGAMVLDHIDRVAYAALSRRTSEVLLERFCTHFNYEPMAFPTLGGHEQPVYHTNVMMCIGTRFALVGLSLITDVQRRQAVADRLRASGREVIELSADQIAHFAGNALELTGTKGSLLAISQRAIKSLGADQRAALEKYTRLLPLQVPTIELAGGSVRCMLAGIHLARR
jgi:hypothetical protein